jgi:hypothetical protein
MQGSTPRRRTLRRLTGTVAAATVAAGLVSFAPTAQGADRPQPAQGHRATVFRQDGRPLTAASDQAPGQVVRSFLQSRGVSQAAVASLQAEGGVWKTRGISHVLMGQTVAGLRVQGAYAKGAVDSSGRLVDLVEDVAPVQGTPVTADIGPDDALGTAVGSLYPGRPVDTAVTRRSGNTTTYARAGYQAAPTVEKVAVPTTDGGLSEGYLVTTWNSGDNALYQTVVGGDGSLVSQELLTAADSYKVFPKDPGSTPQTDVTAPADPTASPFGWLSGAQRTTEISGNNVHAYLDANNDDAPDAGGTPVDGGVFNATEDFGKQPSEDPNRAVAVQNLFYLNNRIHDTLYKAGFTDAAGNFQQQDTSPVGNAGDPVQAEAQDGGGTDNANFATPPDGKSPRMQMYLWSVPGMYEVVVPDAPTASTRNATNAEWGSPLTKDGVTGTLAVAEDGTGTPTDACEPLSTTYSRPTIVIADRGACTFTQKAKNAQDAGASGIVIAALADSPQPVTMGGSDPSVTITGEMVGYSDGAALKAAAGNEATLRLTQPAPIMKDGDLDSDIVFHEYGHGLTWRMINHMDGPLSGAIGEGMSDVLAEIMNGDPVIGEYAAGDPAGIRTHSYEGYNRTYGQVTGSEVHLDGEVYGAIGWELIKEYEDAGRTSQGLLADLVNGMNYTQPWPAFEDMRDGILAGLANSGEADRAERACDVWRAFAKYGVGMGADGKVVGGPVSGPYASGKRVVVDESFATPKGC